MIDNQIEKRMLDSRIDKGVCTYLGAIDWGKLYSKSLGIIDDSCEEYVEICEEFNLDEEDKWDVVNYMEEKLSDMYDQTITDLENTKH